MRVLIATDRSDVSDLLIFGDHWTCALLRAELLERGGNAACVDRLGAALVPSSPISLSGHLIVVAELEWLSERDRLALAWLRALAGMKAFVLIASASAALPPGPWDHVLRRPISLGEIADLLGRLTGRPQPASRCPRGMPGFEVRTGFPWAMVRCTRCSASRHCEIPRTGAALGDVRQALVMFGLAHERCHGRAEGARQ